MNYDYIIAIKKLVRNSGIRFAETLQLEKRNFDLQNKTIIYKRCVLYRKATIRPDDVNWFKEWFESIPDATLFPFPERTIRYNLRKYGISKIFDFRKELYTEMQKLNASDDIIATKLGHMIDESDTDDNQLFKKLQEWEEKQYGENI